jgi:hypothetical protein
MPRSLCANVRSSIQHCQAVEDAGRPVCNFNVKSIDEVKAELVRAV